ncbi:MAG: hypothetical protein H6819_01925 [Phycisphaerales bacterium]|nr:hypothetical protein [Phycisphaerales bacterium]MCB9857031.1 hypothetical protein [Phycisphaerales bacterium]MCB9861842.1 hypothetical protein [Phycisphaerales bacterium]
MHQTAEHVQPSEQHRELGAIIRAYSDVTDRLKQAHDRLTAEVARLSGEIKLKNAELRRKDRLAALGEMAAGLAHEVRNPLGGIALYSSKLERDLSDRPESMLAASRITQGVRDLDRLVSEILDFAQEDRLERQSVPLGSILTMVEDGAAHWSERSGATLLIDPAAREVGVFCDAQRLRQVLLNLVINGLQAAGAGGRVQLTAKRRGKETQIDVWDTGPGIPAEVRDRIFNPFFTTKDTGTGLGLAIVHRIIEAHGGTVRVTSDAKTGGARFVMRLPNTFETRVTIEPGSESDRRRVGSAADRS